MRFLSGAARGRALRLAVLPLTVMWLMPAPASAGKSKGAMEIGLSGRYAMPGGDLDQLDPAFGYGIMFQYWLTHTSTVMVGLETMSFAAPFTVNGADESLTYTDNLLEVGIRYRPKLDFFLTPFVEAAIGYHFWSTEPGPGYIDPRSGSGMAYLIGAGWEQDITHNLSYGFDFRYYYLPMRENLEESARLNAAGEVDLDKRPIRENDYLSAGISLTYRIK